MNLVSRTLTGRTLKDSLVGDIICESTGEIFTSAPSLSYTIFVIMPCSPLGALHLQRGYAMVSVGANMYCIARPSGSCQ